MDAKTVKEKIINGLITEEELSKLLTSKASHKGSFLKTLLKGVNEGYIIPSIQKTMFESFLILTIITGIIILSYHNKMDNTITAALLATVLGYLFGKIR